MFECICVCVCVCVCLFVGMCVCLCSFRHHLHPSHLSAADFPLNMIEKPLAMNNTFTLYCTSGKVLHDLFPLLEDVRNGGGGGGGGGTLRSSRKQRLGKQRLGKQRGFKVGGKKCLKRQKNKKKRSTNKKKREGEKLQQQSVVICVGSRTAVAGKGETRVCICAYVCSPARVCVCVCPWVSAHTVCVSEGWVRRG